MLQRKVGDGVVKLLRNPVYAFKAKFLTNNRIISTVWRPGRRMRLAGRRWSGAVLSKEDTTAYHEIPVVVCHGMGVGSRSAVLLTCLSCLGGNNAS